MRVSGVLARICIDTERAFFAALRNAEELQPKTIYLFIRREWKHERNSSPANTNGRCLDDWSRNVRQTAHGIHRWLH
jgi:hypothetical protein